MQRSYAFALLLLVVPSDALLAQNSNTPQSTAAPVQQLTFTSYFGFSYTYPSDWEVVNAQTTLPDVKKKLNQEATSEDEKKGVDCTQLAFFIRHGAPASAIEAVVLPYDCFGSKFTDKDLPDFGAGAAEGLKSSADLFNPVISTYSLGKHLMWIQKAPGNFKGRPDQKMTSEVVCGLLDKGAICWMAFATTDDALKTFEQSLVGMEGDPPAQLVPSYAFANAVGDQSKPN